jgi:hypothetical protein
MATVTKNRTYGKIAGFWVITQKPLIRQVMAIAHMALCAR